MGVLRDYSLIPEIGFFQHKLRQRLLIVTIGYFGEYFPNIQ